MKIGIFDTAFLGDLVLCSLMIEALHRAGHRIFLFSNKMGCSFYLHDSRIEKCFVVQKQKGIKKLLAMFEISRAISSTNLDLLLVPHRSATSSLIAWLASVPRTVGYQSSSFAFLHSEQLTRDLSRHECLRDLDLIPQDIISNNLRQEMEQLHRPILDTSHEPATFHQHFPFLQKKPSRYFIVFPSSVWPTKIYPPEFMADILLEINNHFPDLHGIIAGSTQDGTLIDTLLQLIQDKHPKDHPFNFHNCCGKIPVAELAATTKGAAFVITNDSGPLHIASGGNVPTIAFFGPTLLDFGFGPAAEKTLLIDYETIHGKTLSCKPCSPHGPTRCPKGHHKCMRELTPELVSKQCVAFVREVIESKNR